MKNKKVLIIISVLVLISFVFGLTFAAYTYNKTGKTSKLIVGDVYMHYNESNEAILTTAEDTSRFYYDGYLANSIMKSQSYTSDTRNELSKCMDYFKYFTFDNGSTNETFCKGTGTYNGSTLQEMINDGYSNDYLYDAGIIDDNNTVNSNMANQSYTSDTRNELSKCADISYAYFKNKSLRPSSKSNPNKFNHKNNNVKFMSIEQIKSSYTRNNFIGLCQGTETVYDSDLINFIDSDALESDLENLNIITQHKGILSSFETNNFVLNENIKSQTYQEDTRNELSKCVDILFDSNSYSLEEATLLCQGGTVNDATLEEIVANDVLASDAINTLIEIGAISSDNVINANMANQSYTSDTRNELSKCVDYFYSSPPIHHDSKSGRFLSNNIKTMASTENVNILTNFCQGTGTNDGTDSGFNIETIYNNSGVNAILRRKNIIVPEEYRLPYFEFTIDGKNTNTKDIVYNVKLIHGDVVSSKTESNRISDKFLMFKLVEVVDGNEVELVNNKKFDTINNTILYSDKVLKNTNTEIKHTYRLYMIVDPDLVVGNTDRSDYSFNDYSNLFASIKVNVDGDYE